MKKAEKLVAQMLENTADAHVKAYQKLKTWDNAIGSYRDLYAQKQKAASIFSELGRALAYERALAYVGLSREQVDRPVYGAQLVRTDNFKGTFPYYFCADPDCDGHRRAQTDYSTCAYCNKPLTLQRRTPSFTDLHGKYARHIVGVDTNGGQRVWFDEPVAPDGQALLRDRPSLEGRPEAPKASANPRLGRGW